jgi:transcriptional regulator with XRE-family HTH domain
VFQKGLPVSLPLKQAERPVRALQFGGRIRALRQRAGMTLRALADEAGISLGFLCQLERNKATPSLGTLASIAAALGVEVNWFIASPRPADAVTREGERIRFSIDEGSLAYERLDAKLAGGTLSSLMIHIPPGYASKSTSQTGEEMILVLEERVRQMLGDAVLILNPAIRCISWAIRRIPLPMRVTGPPS